MRWALFWFQQTCCWLVTNQLKGSLWCKRSRLLSRYVLLYPLTWKAWRWDGFRLWWWLFSVWKIHCLHLFGCLLWIFLAKYLVGSVSSLLFHNLRLRVGFMKWNLYLVRRWANHQRGHCCFFESLVASFFICDLIKIWIFCLKNYVWKGGGG